MLKLYLIIGKDRFYLYNERREIVYIEANPFFLYESNKIREAAVRLTEKIVDENNLSDKSELRFIVIENSDNVRNESVVKELGNLIVQKYSIYDLIRKTLAEFAKDSSLYIKELGINYDGESERKFSNAGFKAVNSFSRLALEIAICSSICRAERSLISKREFISSC